MKRVVRYMHRIVLLVEFDVGIVLLRPDHQQAIVARIGLGLRFHGA